jgi:hypothetical protein
MPTILTCPKYFEKVGRQATAAAIMDRLLLVRSRCTSRPQPFRVRRARESREIPRFMAFCRSAGRVRLNCRAILAAETFRRARLFSSRISALLQGRRLIFFLAFFAIIAPCLPHTENHISAGAGIYHDSRGIVLSIVSCDRALLVEFLSDCETYRDSKKERHGYDVNLGWMPISIKS